MGKNRFWHGGVHIHPSDRATPIRAIADGELVAYRFDESDETDAFFDKVPYSRSFVLLKHEAELGQTALGTSKLVFFSLYMHLQAWGKVKGKAGDQGVNFLKKHVPEKPRMARDGKTPLLDKEGRQIMTKATEEVTAPVADGACHSGSSSPRVRRGDILGYAGTIPDNLDSPSTGIHFEIFFDDVSFLENQKKTIWGRCTLSSELLVYDELLASETLAVDPSKPLVVDTAKSTDTYWKISHQRKDYWASKVQITEREVDVPDPKNRSHTTKKTQYFANSDKLIAFRKNPAKNETKLSTGTAIIPWLGPWLKPGEFREEQMDGKTWIQVYLPSTNDLTWADKSLLRFTSDADWQDFHKLEEHGQYSADGFIDDEGLKVILDSYAKNSAEGNTNAKNSDAAKLRNFITKHPSEWSNQDIANRFERVTRDEFGPSKLNAAQFNKLTSHISRLSFWEQVAGLPAKEVWHAHPIRFIEHLAKCMWLSERELQLVYPDKKDATDPVIHGTSTEVREKYRVEINKCCYRYGINSRLRQTHFFGQGAVECKSLNAMLEEASGSRYEGNHNLGNTQPGDGPNFKGRGFKQLTGRYNYAEYWSFKGWIKKGTDFDIGWESDPHKRFPKIDNPAVLAENAFDCIDAGCWYIALFRSRTVAAMDADDIVKVTTAINGGDNGIQERTKFTELIRKVLL